MALIRTEEEVDQLISDMISRNKGKYITQGISFNKESEIQLLLLKLVLMRASSFGGFIRELLSKEFHNEMTNFKPKKYKKAVNIPVQKKVESTKPIIKPATNPSSDLGNFL